MPNKLKRPCSKIGCPELSNESYCPEHKREKVQKYDKARGTATERGYSSRWAAYSRLFRKKNPLCVECFKEGEIIGSQHVDHIIAVSGPDDPLFWLASNHSALCASCHSRKTVNEDHGFGR